MNLSSCRWKVLLIALAVVGSAPGSAAQAAATADTETLRIPFENVIGVTNPCNGDFILLSGTQTLIIHSNTTADGGSNALVRSIIQAEGVGDLTGVTYRFSNTSLIRGSGNAQSFTHTDEGDAVIVAEGAAPNFVGHFTAFINLTPSGHQNSFLISQEKCVG